MTLPRLSILSDRHWSVNPKTGKSGLAHYRIRVGGGMQCHHVSYCIPTILSIKELPEGSLPLLIGTVIVTSYTSTLLLQQTLLIRGIAHRGYGNICVSRPRSLALSRLLLWRCTE